MRSHDIKWYHMVPLLLAVPLSAQDNTIITVNDTTVVNIYDNDSTFIFVDLADTDSVAAAVQQQFHEAVIAYLETCGCMEGGGTSGFSTATQGAILLALGFIGWQLRGIKDKDDSHTINVPAPPLDDYDSEGRGESG